MKLYFISLFLCCLGSIDVTLGLSKRVHHHPGHPDPQQAGHIFCVDRYCDDHKSSCIMQVDGPHIHGHCAEPPHCDHLQTCTGTMHNGECCCRTPDCVTNYLAAIHTPHQPNVLNCFGSHCNSDHQGCVVSHRPGGSISGWCEDHHHCDNEYWGCIEGNGHLTHHHECCCRDSQCIATLNNAYFPTKAPITNAPVTQAPVTQAPTTAAHATVPVTTKAPTVQITTPTPLYCPVCADDFTADCQRNAMCKANEGCMLQVIAGKLQTGCAEINDCEYHERVGDSICCKDKNCTDYAFRNMHSMSYTCPTCQNTQNPNSCLAHQGKCSYRSKGCMITHNNGGISSGCNSHPTACHMAETTNSVLCNVHPIPFAFQPALQCSFCCHRNASTCILDALGAHDVSTPPPTLGHTAGTTAASCFDIEDATFNCKSFDATYNLCVHSSGLMAQLATTKCRKTCGICGGSGGVVGGSGAAGPTVGVTVRTTTPGATFPTTTQFPCIDHDINNNCALMSSVLCLSQNNHARNYAIANCAKTCNLCKEYHQHLSGLTVPGKR
ncbi:uncharacterized protein LOC110464959 isoform X2 [Mizuhopecten yessoensis]|uniref:uncharacterized protein LOC110464959 isoform X2 n=1 Tax=Mizuhopecten yessoensis TaxID=6573 RepID=UPI000B45E0E2|nr:uncharacterized protein LOC110464959 isoform X2 [Mizuhopecten yessoensis]